MIRLVDIVLLARPLLRSRRSPIDGGHTIHDDSVPSVPSIVIGVGVAHGCLLD